jgi:hypothetical protein
VIEEIKITCKGVAVEVSAQDISLPLDSHGLRDKGGINDEGI